VRRKNDRKRAVLNSSPRPPHSSPVIQVAAGLICRQGRYLIARRKSDTHLGGLWEFPGGKREADESLEACLFRELREELGVDVMAPTLLRTIRHDYPGRTVELHFFRCAIRRGKAQPLDCDEIRWVTPKEMSAYEFLSADRALIEALQHP